MEPDLTNFRFGDYTLLSAERLLLRDGQVVPLKSKIFETLLALILNRHKVVGKDELMELIWPGTFVEEGNLSQSVYSLRKILGEKPGEHRFIVTVPRTGYRFVAKVHEMSANGSAAQAPRRIESLAILPLKVLDDADSVRYVGLALADSLITNLGKSRIVKVRPTTAVIPFVETDADPVSIGRELQVDAILAGTIQKGGDKLRINIQLTDVRSLETIWTETIDTNTADVLALQDQVAGSVAESLALELGGDDNKEFVWTDVELYQKYLKARFFWERRNEAGLKKALHAAQEVVAEEPNCAMGHIGVADSHLLLGEYLYVPPDEAFPAARESAERALEIAPDLAEAHASLAEYFFYYARDWSRAEAFYRRSIELDPNYATAYHWYSWLLIAMNRYDEAQSQIEKAQSIDPNSLILSTIRALPFYYRGEYSEAIQQLRDVLEIDPNSHHARYYLGSALIHAGETTAAVAEFKSVLLAEDLVQAYGLLGHSYAVAGDESKAREMLLELDRIAAERYVSPYVRAIVYAGLRENDEATRLLQKAFDEKDAWMVWANADPCFDTLRGRDGFEKILAKMGFPSVASATPRRRR